MEMVPSRAALSEVWVLAAISFLVVVTSWGCSVGGSSVMQMASSIQTPDLPRMVNAQNAPRPTPTTELEDSKSVKCGDNDYELRVVRPYPDEYLNVELSSSGHLSTIRTPGWNEYENFWATTAIAKGGFDISVEWGTRYGREIHFSFKCKDARFVLVEVESEIFDKYDQSEKVESMRKRVIPISNIPFAEVSIEKYTSIEP
jgi:hypothetical protein